MNHGPTVTMASRLGRAAVPLLLAALLTGAAVVTVDRAGCDTPAEYVTTDDGVVLEGGCTVPGVGAGVATSDDERG